MRKLWSKEWNKSKQPRKQRKYRRNAPLHIKTKFLGVNLSETLRKETKKRSIIVRKGDEVVITRGEHRGKMGEVIEVDSKKTRVYVKDIVGKKGKGTEFKIPIHPSNLQISKLNLDDPRRIEKIKKKK